MLSKPWSSVHRAFDGLRVWSIILYSENFWKCFDVLVAFISCRNLINNSWRQLVRDITTATQHIVNYKYSNHHLQERPNNQLIEIEIYCEMKSSTKADVGHRLATHAWTIPHSLGRVFSFWKSKAFMLSIIIIFSTYIWILSIQDTRRYCR